MGLSSLLEAVTKDLLTLCAEHPAGASCVICVMTGCAQAAFGEFFLEIC